LSRRPDFARLSDIRSALADIRELTLDGKQAFLDDRTAQQAVAYNLAVLGEAARALSDELRQSHPDVPWRDVIAQRNVVVHEYHRLDLEVIWNTVANDVPRLYEQIAELERSLSAKPDTGA
jgi:uncharacterized protein with HEPN domain